LTRSFRSILDFIPGIIDHNNYTNWINRYDTLTVKNRSTLLKQVSGFSKQPIISIQLTRHTTCAEKLEKTIDSIINQIYPHWELCIPNYVSTDITIQNILRKYTENDSRITILPDKPGSNITLTNVSGEWIALLEPGTLLAESALFWIAKTINHNPDIYLIYSDEDKIDKSGRRFNPYFKCDWNIDLFYSRNLLDHFGVFSISKLKDIGGFNPRTRDTEYFYLSLRYIESINRKQIYHIPRILYHWEVDNNQTALPPETSPSAILAGEKALNEHFSRIRIKAKAQVVRHGYRIHYALPDTFPMVSLIIPTRNGLDLLRQCIFSILEKTLYPNYEILIIDNASDDIELLKYLNTLSTDPKINILRDENPFNYSALNNKGVKLAKGELVGLLNNDLEVISPEWLSEMVSIALQPNVGAVGAKLWYPNDTLQHGGVILGIRGWAGHAHKGYSKLDPGYMGRMSLTSGFSAVTGACLIVRKKLYEELDGLNDIDLQVACSDVDFCLRLREAGYRNVWTPYAELYHHESATRGYENTPEKRVRFSNEVDYMINRWGDLLRNDPAYSPNLTLDSEDFSLAWPPRNDWSKINLFAYVDKHRQIT